MNELLFYLMYKYVSVCDLFYQYADFFPSHCSGVFFISFKDFYLLNFLERRRTREREGGKHQCVVASHVSLHWGPGGQPRLVPQTGNQTGNPLIRRPIFNHLATPARAPFHCFWKTDSDIYFTCLIILFNWMLTVHYLCDKHYS